MELFGINIEDRLNIHDKSLDHFGGSDGIRDRGLLESVIARPLQLFHNEQASLYRLAACYAYGMIKNHPFIYGNKRTGFIACALLLQSNGLLLIASEEDDWLILSRSPPARSRKMITLFGFPSHAKQCNESPLIDH
jgi:death on curing protein